MYQWNFIYSGGWVVMHFPNNLYIEIFNLQDKKFIIYYRKTYINITILRSKYLDTFKFAII